MLEVGDWGSGTRGTRETRETRGIRGHGDTGNISATASSPPRILSASPTHRVAASSPNPPQP
ncbi:MAG: hypothetical protein NHB32_29920 [Fischerella sp. CENA71]|nr:hypothetical protein [Fischerella sp. CENA71]